MLGRVRVLSVEFVVDGLVRTLCDTRRDMQFTSVSDQGCESRIHSALCCLATGAEIYRL